MFKKFWEWVKRPHGWVLIPFYIFALICIAAAIAFSIFGHGTGFEIAAYIFYVLAAITLGYSVYTIVYFVPKAKRKVTEKLKSNRFAANMLENYDFKTTVFAIISFCITVAFAIMNLVSAIYYRLIWYGAISAYYFVLIFFRGGILLANKKCAKKFNDNAGAYEKSMWKIYLASGAFLILLEFAMIGAVTQMMLSGRPTRGGEIMAISNAAYTFSKLIMAVYNLIKARKFSNPVTQSLRTLNFADACMSAVSLTVLMISTFDTSDSVTSMLYVKSIVGFAACAGIIAVATYMIIRANKKLQNLKGETDND